MKPRHFFRYGPAMMLIALASCGARNQAEQAKGGSAVEDATPARISLVSSAFQNGQPIPTEYSCDGANKSPAIQWNEPPAGTKSFALVIDDPDAPSGTFRHWGAYDIPASTRSLTAGQSIGSQAVNDFGKSGYGGPCPPRGHGPHHYHFKLFALDVERLNLGSNPNVLDVENEAIKHATARGELIGTYERR